MTVAAGIMAIARCSCPTSKAKKLKASVPRAALVESPTSPTNTAEIIYYEFDKIGASAILKYSRLPDSQLKTLPRS